MTRRCPRCERVLSLEAFGRSRNRPLGRDAYCRACVSARFKERWHTDPDFRAVRSSRAQRWKETPEGRAHQRRVTREAKERHRDKIRARKALEQAVRRGTIPKPATCSRCGASGKIEGHHHDYRRRFDVAWFCTACHAAEHRLARVA